MMQVQQRHHQRACSQHDAMVDDGGGSPRGRRRPSKRTRSVSPEHGVKRPHLILSRKLSYSAQPSRPSSSTSNSGSVSAPFPSVLAVASSLAASMRACGSSATRCSSSTSSHADHAAGNNATARLLSLRDDEDGFETDSDYADGHAVEYLENEMTPRQGRMRTLFNFQQGRISPVPFSSIPSICADGVLGPTSSSQHRLSSTHSSMSIPMHVRPSSSRASSIDSLREGQSRFSWRPVDDVCEMGGEPGTSSVHGSTVLLAPTSAHYTSRGRSEPPLQSGLANNVMPSGLVAALGEEDQMDDSMHVDSEMIIDEESTQVLASNVFRPRISRSATPPRAISTQAAQQSAIGADHSATAGILSPVSASLLKGKARYSMGYKRGCERCERGEKGHYSHIEYD